MLAAPGHVSGAQIAKGSESLEGAETAPRNFRVGDAEDVGNSGAVVTMRGGSDPRSRYHYRRDGTRQEAVPSTSSMRPDARTGGSETRGTVAPSQRQSASAQQTPNARG